MNDATLMEDTGKAGAWRQRLAAPEPVASLRRARNGLGNLLSRCPLMTEVFNQIERVAPTRVSVLVTGESGTGKELVARTIHECSGRSSGPFVAVNCGAIPASLIEAELFGHERGSFTGAIRTQIGYFERAGGGTLFLDEIGEMPLEMQVKLLRALESGVICRIGGEREMPVEARVIAATNRNPAEAVAQGRCASAATTSSSSRATSSRVSIARKAATSVCRAIQKRSCASTTGPEMCVSCTTSCSGPSSWPTASSICAARFWAMGSSPPRPASPTGCT